MADWKAKRFWKAASVTGDAAEGWGVALDGRPVRTPAKARLAVPSRALADRIAAEWDAQDGEIDPLSMPFTRSANAAIDKVAPQLDAVAAMIADYGETDLCCYRAAGPEVLCRQQAEAWDPLLVWAREALGAGLVPTVGVVPVAQPVESLDRLRDRVGSLDAFALTALHDLVSLSGSLLLGLAVLEGHLPAEEAWRRSRIDETYQESQWGVDELAAAAAAAKRGEFLHAIRFHDLSRADA
jgi:chaperone required for assembly of F1-ATPase